MRIGESKSMINIQYRNSQPQSGFQAYQYIAEPLRNALGPNLSGVFSPKPQATNPANRSATPQKYMVNTNNSGHDNSQYQSNYFFPSRASAQLVTRNDKKQPGDTVTSQPDQVVKSKKEPLPPLCED